MLNWGQIFLVDIVLERHSNIKLQTFTRFQYLCRFVVGINDQMQYCHGVKTRLTRARNETAESHGTRLLHAAWHFTPCGRVFLGGLQLSSDEESSSPKFVEEWWQLGVEGKPSLSPTDPLQERGRSVPQGSRPSISFGLKYLGGRLVIYDQQVGEKGLQGEAPWGSCQWGPHNEGL